MGAGAGEVICRAASGRARVGPEISLVSTPRRRWVKGCSKVVKAGHRQTTGFVESLLRFIDLDWIVPNFRGMRTGIKVEGEGEWNARMRGGAKHRVWRKIHIGIDEKSLEIRAAKFTTSDIGDAPIPPELPNQIPPEQEIARVTADGAYDTRKRHGAIAARGAAAIISPRKNARGDVRPSLGLGNRAIPHGVAQQKALRPDMPHRTSIRSDGVNNPV